jgi:hypothetical protein
LGIVWARVEGMVWDITSTRVGFRVRVVSFYGLKVQMMFRFILWDRDGG